MGLRGPQPTPKDVLEKRGSWRAGPKKRQATKSPRRFVIRSRPRAIERLEEHCRTLLPGYDPWRNADDFRWDEGLARDAIQWIQENCCHAKGDKGLRNFDLEPWQHAVYGNLYGWVHCETGTRRYSEAFIYVPRKNGKTPMAAIIIMAQLFTSDEIGQEIYGAAKSHSQATYVFDHVRTMVAMHPGHSERAQIFKGQAKAIQLGEDTGWSTYRCICSDSDTAQGLNANCVVLDEVHAQPNRDLYEALKRSLSARTDPLFVGITTADFERENSVCNDLHDQSKQIIEGVIDVPSFLPVIFEAGKDDDWEDPAIWRKANPNLGISKMLNYMETECKRAKRQPAALNSFLRYELNVRTDQAERWITKEEWDACYESFKLDDMAGAQCSIGLDLGSTSDLTALCRCFRGKDGVYRYSPRFWCSRKQVEDEEYIGHRYYADWARQGFLDVTPGNRTDYEYILACVREECKRFKLRYVYMDTYMANLLANQLKNLENIEVIKVDQTCRGLNAATKLFDVLVGEARMRHDGNPVMNWNIANCSIYRDSNDNMKPDKWSSGGKIDGVVAAIMATAGLLVEKPKAKAELFFV